MLEKVFGTTLVNPALADRIEAGVREEETRLADIERRIDQARSELRRTDRWADHAAARHHLRELEPEAKYLRGSIRADRRSAQEARQGYTTPAKKTRKATKKKTKKKTNLRSAKPRLRVRLRSAVRRSRKSLLRTWQSWSGTGTVATARRRKGGGATVREHTRGGRVVRAHTRVR